MASLFLFRLMFLFGGFFTALFFVSRLEKPDPRNTLVAQNTTYVNPRIQMDGSYVPGYYQGPGAKNPYYFNPDQEQFALPMPQTPRGATYFQLNPNMQENPLVYSPYYYPNYK